MQSTPIAVLHEHGLTFHQTGPLKSAGYDTAEAVAELVDAHRGYPLTDSALSRVSSMGPKRVALVCDAVDAWRAAGAPQWTVEHTPIKHDDCDNVYCMFCQGGLFGCSVCGSFEGATTTHCPGVSMGLEYGERVYAGEIDFRDGEWRVGECSRHTPAYWSTAAGLAEIEKAGAEG